jgi:hypothetical protein
VCSLPVCVPLLLPNRRLQPCRGVLLAMTSAAARVPRCSDRWGERGRADVT